MAIEKIEVLDRIEIPESLILHLRYATYFVEDGKRISEPTYRRTTISPGEVSTERDKRVLKALELHTPEVVTEFRERIKAALKFPQDEVGVSDAK